MCYRGHNDERNIVLFVGLENVFATIEECSLVSATGGGGRLTRLPPGADCALGHLLYKVSNYVFEVIVGLDGARAVLLME